MYQDPDRSMKQEQGHKLYYITCTLPADMFLTFTIKSINWYTEDRHSLDMELVV